MKRRERSGGGIFQRVGQGLLGREIGGPDQAEPVDQQHLLLRAAAHQPAILELGGGQRAHQAGFGSRQARHGALHGQRGDQRACPGGNPGQARRGLVGSRIEMPRAARQRVEQRRAIAGIAAGQDVGRIGGPEEDPLAPQFGRPGLVDPCAMGDQPAAGDRLGQPRAFFAAGRGGEVAQPGEALHFARQRRRASRARRKSMSVSAISRCRAAGGRQAAHRPGRDRRGHGRAAPRPAGAAAGPTRTGARSSEPLASRPTTSSLMPPASSSARSAAILAAY